MASRSSDPRQLSDLLEVSQTLGSTLNLRMALLRVLETWEVRPVGSPRDVAVDVRVVAASNRELVTLVQQGRFRADLYARLAQWIIRIPPLRDRREDIPIFVTAFLERIAKEHGEKGKELSPEAQEVIMAYDWPGNVRELENALERALILAGDDEIRAEHLAPATVAAVRTRAVDALLAEGFDLDAHERALVHAAIERAGGNKTLAAKLLGIKRWGPAATYAHVEHTDQGTSLSRGTRRGSRALPPAPAPGPSRFAGLCETGSRST